MEIIAVRLSQATFTYGLFLKGEAGPLPIYIAFVVYTQSLYCLYYSLLLPI